MTAKPYELSYTDVALRYLESDIPVKMRLKIRNKIEALAFEPIPRGSKKIRGISDDSQLIYRIRHSSYRIIYLIRDDANEIVVLDIGHRRDVYRMN